MKTQQKSLQKVVLNITTKTFSVSFLIALLKFTNGLGGEHGVGNQAKPSHFYSTLFSSLKAIWDLIRFHFIFGKISSCPYLSQDHKLKLLLLKKKRRNFKFSYAQQVFTCIFSTDWFVLLVAIFVCWNQSLLLLLCFPRLLTPSFYGSYYSFTVFNTLRLRKIREEIWNCDKQNGIKT